MEKAEAQKKISELTIPGDIQETTRRIRKYLDELVEKV